MELLVIAIGIALVLLLARDRWRSSTEKRYLREVIGRMSKEQLRRQFEASCAITTRQLIDPALSSISASESAKHLQRAVYCKDRLNRLEGREHGPAFRERLQTELARHLQGIANTRKPD